MPVSAGDYDLDGDIDIMAIIDTTAYFEIKILKNTGCSGNSCSFELRSLDSALFSRLDKVEPFLLDPKGLGIPTIVVSRNGNRQILQTNEGNQYFSKNFTDTFHIATNLSSLDKHQTALIDFNGDCRADVVLISKSDKWHLQFYEHQKTGVYQFVKIVNFTNEITRMSFSDINSDGSNDIALIIKNNDAYELHIYYHTYENQQICKQYPDFPYTFSPLQVLKFNLTESSRITFGDVNSDGYPDILTTSQNDFLQPLLLLNQPCEHQECPDKGRTYRYDPVADIVKNICNNTFSTSFTDIAFDGRLDILVNCIRDNRHLPLAIINNLKQDTFFIKAQPLTAFSSEDDSKFPNSFGVTFQWKITTLQGTYKISQIGQLSQQTGLALQLPFICTGLGRTNNYLQDFTVVYAGEGNNQTWTPIIPNSQLLIFPYDDKNQWSLGIYISSVQKIKQVVLITTIILILIGLVILYLIRKEAEEDRRNQYMFFQLIR